jgi:hypothetical protein
MSIQNSLNIERMCQLANVSRVGFYRSLQERELAAENMQVRSAIQEIFAEHKRRYGYRRVSAELRRRGPLVNDKRVARFDCCYNRVRLRSVLGYRPPEEFEQPTGPETVSQAATHEFFHASGDPSIRCSIKCKKEAGRGPLWRRRGFGVK